MMTLLPVAPPLLTMIPRYRTQSSVLPHLVPVATHAAREVPNDWFEEFKGKFDMGWNKYRMETLASAWPWPKVGPPLTLRV